MELGVFIARKMHQERSHYRLLMHLEHILRTKDLGVCQIGIAIWILLDSSMEFHGTGIFDTQKITFIFTI